MASIDAFVDGCWWSLEVARNAVKYVIVLIAVHFLWTFKQRVQRRVARDRQQRQRQLGGSYFDRRSDTVQLDKATQWEPQPTATATALELSARVVRNGELITNLANGKQRNGREEEEGTLKTMMASGKRNSVCEGIMAKKSQIMNGPLSRRRSSDYNQQRPVATVNVTKMQNGHVNSLKMRFEETPSEDLPIKTTAKLIVENNVPVIVEPLEETPEKTNEYRAASPVVVLRVKKLEKSVLNRSSCSVHSLEDILTQQRFSRSLSQYSVSDLCFNESLTDINKQCEQFDRLFSRSNEELYRSQEDSGI